MKFDISLSGFILGLEAPDPATARDMAIKALKADPSFMDIYVEEVKK